ncbi:MAG TPA: DUF1538 domain-containing protein [Candidatus Omnitrophota bacterium]|nr:DUF1538 domain-containing protein [Candidatus Omnitrophota bacterium]
MMTGFPTIVMEVISALFPLGALFIISNIFLKKLSRRRVVEVSAGFILILLGLSLFLQGVYSGFLPMGRALGEAFAAWPHKWVLVPFGFVLGFAGTMAEPAVRVLNYQVEKITSGYIPQKIMLFTLSTGVGVSVSLAMLRILTGLPLRNIVIAGYAAVFVLMVFSKRSFVAIAFDSGGVASGPMTATFITAMAIGAASGIEGRDPLIYGLGLVALVALLPIITVLALGLLYDLQERRIKRRETAGRIIISDER